MAPLATASTNGEVNKANHSVTGEEQDGDGVGVGDATSLAEPKSAMTGKGRVKHDAPQVQLEEADEFGLAVRPARRRGEYSLDELESPEELKAAVIKQMEHLKGEKTGGVEGTSSRDKEDMGDNEDHTAVFETGHVQGDAQAEPAAGTASHETTPTKNTPASPATFSQHHHTPQKPSVSEWSHQQLAPKSDPVVVEEEEEQWQDMPALAEHRIYDDWGKVLAKSYSEVPDDTLTYSTLGGAGRGYTKVQIDEDAQSATSMDDNTAYLFPQPVASTVLGQDDDDEQAPDLVSQMRTTKELLTEAQRIAYVGVVRLSIRNMEAGMEPLDKSLKGTKRFVEFAAEALRMWGQKMMVRLYQHMEITSQEQVMVEQLAEHGVQPGDLIHVLMQNARVKNPGVKEARVEEAEGEKAGGEEAGVLADEKKESGMVTESELPSISSPKQDDNATQSSAANLSPSTSPDLTSPPPAYEEKAASNLTVQPPSDLTTAPTLDLDLRWTVLCDLFLLLIADSTYDARSRTLLECVGAALSVSWQEICRFEKRVTDAMELQEQAEKENWNEAEHIQQREKAARNKRLMVMGLCTVGGGIIIGLSAGALAPVIGAGLAAGFTGIGIAGTGGFLAGTGAAALIGTTGTLIGGGIGMKTSHRRTGAVRTFEYKPLFNNKRANLIVNVAGWMAGKVDDVRLPFSTVNPVMGDIYSVNWEPEMLQSTGETIQILGTEALTQTIQQILGATFLATLMAGLTLPIVLTKLSYLIDNPWTVSLARADATGLILADSLIDRNLGVRPITLVGFSLGSRVIFSCLKELVKRGALGLVQNVYMFGSPVVVKKEEWTRARTVVSGRFVNAYATNDWILAYLFRATSGGLMRVAGLSTVQVPGIESIDVTATVPGHMAYRGMMPTLLQEVGWEVESVEFTEIEDPDPEDHARRQRELISEIEEARRQLDEDRPAEKKGWWGKLSLRGRQKRAAERKGWETYNEEQMAYNNRTVVLEGEERDAEQVVRDNADVMFDVEAIRREALALALGGADVEDLKAHLNVREIESTLPALKIQSPKAVEAAQVEGGAGADTTNVGSSTPATDGGGGKQDLARPSTHDGLMSADDKVAASKDELANGTRMNGDDRRSTFSRGMDLRHSSDNKDGYEMHHSHLPERSAEDEAAEEEVTLSFDHDSPVQPQPHPFQPADRSKPTLHPQTSDAIRDAHLEVFGAPLRETESALLQEPRPMIHSAQSTPSPAKAPLTLPPSSEGIKARLETSHLSNPWAEEGEGQAGRELGGDGRGDVEMSFE